VIGADPAKLGLSGKKKRASTSRAAQRDGALTPFYYARFGGKRLETHRELVPQAIDRIAVPHQSAKANSEDHLADVRAAAAGPWGSGSWVFSGQRGDRYPELGSCESLVRQAPNRRPSVADDSLLQHPAR